MKLNTFTLIGILFFQLSCTGQRDFPMILQESAMQCGPICLQMIGKHYGKDLDIEKLEINSKMSDIEGTSFEGLGIAADSIGFRTMAVKIPFKMFVEEAPLPAIVHWKQNHFVVVYQATKKKIYVADPSIGKVEYTKDEFCKSWLQSDFGSKDEGVVLLLELTDRF